MKTNTLFIEQPMRTAQAGECFETFQLKGIQIKT